jgi:pseudouridylate synthase
VPNEGYLRIHPEVAAALAERRPVVALESTLLAHGLPRPGNLEVAARIEAAVRDAGAVPATVAVLDGRVRVGLDGHALRRVCADVPMAKLAARDIAPALAAGGSGATTVASTARLAARAGIAVFATGGLGGVHRQAAQSFDESADLATLAGTPVLVVCAGVKSILDVAATLERLESLSVTVLGYRTGRFPGFYLADSGLPLDWQVDSPAQAAAVFTACRQLGGGAVVLANPLPEAEQLDPGLHRRVLDSGLAGLARDGVRGKAVTPYLLDHFHRETAGASQAVNVRIILRNATLAAQVAAELVPAAAAPATQAAPVPAATTVSSVPVPVPGVAAPAAPGSGTPGPGTPGPGTPGPGTPGSGTPGPGTPGPGTPGPGTPGSGTPGSGTPGSGTQPPAAPRARPA